MTSRRAAPAVARMNRWPIAFRALPETILVANGGGNQLWCRYRGHLLSYRVAMKDSCLALRFGLFGLLLFSTFSGISRGQNYIRIEPEVEARAREQIEAALSGMGSIECVDKPLRELADDLSRRMGVSIFLAKESLEDAAISLETPVTARISGVS